MQERRKFFIFLVFGSMLVLSTIPNGYSQLTDEDEKGCIVKTFREQAYAPFRIVQVGDPAIKNSIEDEHQNPNSRWHLDRAEYEEPESPTILNFYTDSVDQWKFTVRTSYKVEALEPRPVTISYQANNVEFLTETFYRIGFDFCIVYYITVSEAPVIPTDEDFLAKADKIQKENFAVVGTQISALIKEVTATKNSNNVINAMSTVLIILLLIAYFMQTRGNKNLKKGMNTERQLLSSERARMMIKSKQDTLDQEKFRKEQKKKMDSFIDYATININSIIWDFEKMKDKVFGENKVETEPMIMGSDGIERPKSLHDQIESNQCPYCPEKFGFSQDYNVHILNKHPEEAKQEIENEKIFETEYLGDGEHKEDPLQLEKARKNPKSFNLKNIKEELTQIKDKIIKKEETPIIKDEKYYIEYYEKKLPGHSELVKEYILQSEAYQQTGNEDAYTRSKALSILSSTNEKFDPRKEVNE